MSRLINSILNEEFEKSATHEIFKNISKISLDYVPDLLPHRELELTKLAVIFKDILTTFNEKIFDSTVILISGARKSGKTVTVKRFGLDLVKYAQNKNFESKVHFVYRHINCMRYRTVYSIFISVIQSFVPEFPIRGFSTFELIKYLKEYLEVSNAYLLLTLDDVEALDDYKDYGILLVTLLENEPIQFGKFKNRISVMLISNSINYFENLDNLSNIQICQYKVIFQEYTTEQVFDILKMRASETLVEHSWIEEDIQQIVDMITSQNNGLIDPRLCLEVLWRSARLAEQKGSSKLEFDKPNVYEGIPIEHSKIELNLKIQEKVILFVIAKIFLKHPDQNFTRIKEIKKEFDQMKSTLNISFKTLGYTSIFNYLQELNKLNLIVTQVSNPQKRGRSTIIKLNILPAHVEVLLRNQLLKIN